MNNCSSALLNNILPSVAPGTFHFSKATNIASTVNEVLAVNVIHPHAFSLTLVALKTYNKVIDVMGYQRGIMTIF